jgi:ergothioneine biosynthesis protein EgtB
MPDASPVKWHRAHTTWFFEEFVLRRFAPRYAARDDRFGFLFNSYYDAVGPRHVRAERGLLTRPSCDEVREYRSHVDTAMLEFLAGPDVAASAVELVVLGLNHEQQHQELALMDVKHLFSRNGFDPAYRPTHTGHTGVVKDSHTSLHGTGIAAGAPSGWVDFDGGLVDAGDEGVDGFAFDNEGPRHTVLLAPFRLQDRLVTAGEWRVFIADGGYERPELWLSDGWCTAQREGWRSPLYWEADGDSFTTLTLHGPRPVRDAEPVVHVSHYEADAYARWAGARLPTEFEWECAAVTVTPGGNLLPFDPTEAPLHPKPATESTPRPRQLFGDVWEWTSSAYLPYPRFAPAPGAVGEYNGKFMSGQMVLRGGSAVTPADHVRASYRNFFYPHQRWVFAGVRLAADA